MPPKRRTSAGPRTQSQQRSQSTISFGKGQPNRVTKPSATQNLAKRSKKDFDHVDPTLTVAEPKIEQPTTAEAAILQQVESEVTAKDEIDPLIQGGVKTEEVLGGRAERSEVGATGGRKRELGISKTVRSKRTGARRSGKGKLQESIRKD